MHLKWSLSSIGMNLKVVSVRSQNQRAWLRSLDMFLSRIGSFTEMPSGRERRDDDAEDTPNMGKEEKRKREGKEEDEEAFLVSSRSPPPPSITATENE